MKHRVIARIEIASKRAGTHPSRRIKSPVAIRPSETRSLPAGRADRKATLGGYRQGGQRASCASLSAFQELRAYISPASRFGEEFPHDLKSLANMRRGHTAQVRAMRRRSIRLRNGWRRWRRMVAFPKLVASRLVYSAKSRKRDRSLTVTARAAAPLEIVTVQLFVDFGRGLWHSSRRSVTGTD